MSNMIELFRHWADEVESDSSVIQLLNKDSVPVAALYLRKLDFTNPDIAICETSTTSEKYYMYINGIAIFFTYYKKCNL